MDSLCAVEGSPTSEVMLIPISKTISADLLTPVSAFLSIAHQEPYAFLLESVEGGEKIGRYTFLGTRPYMIVTARGREITIQRGRRTEHITADLLPTLKRIFAERQTKPVSGMPPFTSGAVGYFAYDAVRQLERIPERAKDDLQTADCTFMFFDRLLAFDHLRHEIQIIATAEVDGKSEKAARAQAEKDIATIRKKLLAGVPAPARKPPRVAKNKLRITSTTPRKRFLRDVERIKEYIGAGDVFQAVLSQRFELDLGVEPFLIYRALRTVNPSPYMYYLRMNATEVLGSSPEMLLRAASGKLDYRPIAGTQPRGETDEEDQRLETHLRGDEKERAEHVMLVDLGRNDLGRVSQTGSVRVKDLMFVERYSHVMHLVSALEGRLREDLSALDAFAACFPAGTLTGAPKVRAMQIIEELEPVRRGIYGGAILYADFAGNLDSCIAIRTMLVKHAKGKARGYIQAGAGIVADSVPEREYEECCNKAKALIRAVEKARNAG
jgi:anthranilate synthase component 1